VHLNRSVIFSDFLRDHKSAAAELQQAFLNPATSRAHQPGNLYEDSGQALRASSLYARILAIEPNASKRWRGFANVQAVDGIDPRSSSG